MKSLIKALVALTPYRIVRRAENRFEAFQYSLSALKSCGFAPTIIIDGGAHLGSFAELAARLFPHAEIHMIEPQAACQGQLRKLATRFHLHSVALGDSDDMANGLHLAATSAPSTGAHISAKGQAVEVATLDDLFDDRSEDRIFLKLDLQGYELRALKGGEHMLERVEVILTEVSFFAQAYEPSILTLMSYLDERDFDLFDIAALSGRTRDNRLKQGDFIFVKRGSSLSKDTSWA